MFGIGCFNMKNEINYGTLFRSALLFNANFIFLIGKRFKRQASDTFNSSRHIPLFEYQSIDKFFDNIPYGFKLVGIELEEYAINIEDYEHPKNAVYLLGAEDNGLPNSILEKCHDIIKLPGNRSMNVSVAGSIVMYDRYIKGLKRCLN